MKKNILIIFLLLLSLFTNSQTITFNKIYSPCINNPNTAYIASSILSQGSGYIISGTSYDTLNINYPSLIFYKVDSIGNVSKIKSFTRNGWNYYYYFSTLIELKNGGYCYVGEMDTANNNPIHFIIRFDTNMDTLWTKIIPNDTVYWEKFGQMYETSDHGFIIVGSKEMSLNNLGVLLVKTDSLGNLLWKKTIPMPNMSGGAQILETSDKGFLINGYSSSSVYKDGNPFLIKTDSTGNIIWVKIIGGNEYDGAGAIAITQEGNYLYAYGYSTYTYPFNEFWNARLNVIKYAPDGTVIWNKLYDTIRLVLNISKLQILPNNDFIAMGLYAERGNTNFFSSFLFKFNANGDSLWRKIYYLKDGSSTDENSLVDNVVNSDGSITACGWVNSDSQIPYQQIWLLKTDSTGYAPGPQNVSIIDLPFLHIDYFELKVFPNPAKTQATVSFPILKSAAVLELYNNLGQMVYTTILNKNTIQTIIDTQVYKRGLYKLVLREKGEIRGQASLIIKN